MNSQKNEARNHRGDSAGRRVTNRYLNARCVDLEQSCDIAKGGSVQAATGQIQIKGKNMTAEWKVIWGPTGFGWWIVEDGWSFANRSSIVATSVPFTRAIQMIKEHNRTSKNGRPRFPLNPDVVRYAMSRNGWKVAPAADMLGISRSTLRRWLELTKEEEVVHN